MFVRITFMMNMMVLMLSLILAAYAFTQCSPGKVVSDKVDAKCEELGHTPGTEAFTQCEREHGMHFEERKRDAMLQMDATKKILDQQLRTMQQFKLPEQQP